MTYSQLSLFLPLNSRLPSIHPGRWRQMAAGQTDPARDRRVLQPGCGTSSEGPLTRGAFLRVHAPTPIKDAPNQPAAQVPLPGEHGGECNRWTHSCD